MLQILQGINNPIDNHRPIEGRWYDDAQLPLQLVDGVPESEHHSEIRGRHDVPSTGDYLPYHAYERNYLFDPDWWIPMDEAYQELRAEQMED